MLLRVTRCYCIWLKWYKVRSTSAQRYITTIHCTFYDSAAPLLPPLPPPSSPLSLLVVEFSSAAAIEPRVRVAVRLGMASTSYSVFLFSSTQMEVEVVWTPWADLASLHMMIVLLTSGRIPMWWSWVYMRSIWIERAGTAEIAEVSILIIIIITRHSKKVTITERKRRDREWHTLYHNGFSGYIESIDNACIQIHTCDDMARRRWKMESEEYMNRKSRKQRGEAEVSILIIIIITGHHAEKHWPLHKFAPKVPMNESPAPVVSTGVISPGSSLKVRPILMIWGRVYCSTDYNDEKGVVR